MIRELFRNDFVVYCDKHRMLQEISRVVDACKTNENYSARVVFSNPRMMNDFIRHNIRYGVVAYTNGQREQCICIIGDDHSEYISFNTSRFMRNSETGSLWIRFDNESILEFLSVTDRRELFSSNSNSTLICIDEYGEVVEHPESISYEVFSDFYNNIHTFIDESYEPMSGDDNGSKPNFKLLEQYLDELTKGGNR